MRFGFVLPGGPARQQIEQAVLAEQAGWDAVFTFEVAYGMDGWSLLAAMSQRTSRVRLGTMLTPLPWRRPWKVASQVATLDELSDGRAILTVGLGAADLGSWGEVVDRRERAELLDDGIDLIAALWAGERTYTGPRHRIDFTAQPWMAETVRPVQRPRVPIWVVGVWPRAKSMRRVLRCDGLVPMHVAPEDRPARGLEPDDVRAMVTWLDEHGGRRPGFDVVTEGETPPDGAAAAEIVRPWADAGCTWWLDARWAVPEQDRDRVVRERLAAGPPPV
jgi:alkanesulfonate monooxygenase SsuD/methylene tetrahydromethanopterin reductase-like flavin-dependent oxidoreductase (luciferase family)